MRNINTNEAVLRLLIQHLNAGASHATIATLLNAEGLRQPKGEPYTAESVTRSLYLLRDNKRYPTRLYRTLLELVFAEQMTVKESQILFHKRVMA